MIFYGNKGSLILFYKDLLIGSYPLSNLKTYERYKFQGEYLILKSLKQNIPIKLQIKTYSAFCHEIYKRKQSKLGIYRSDYERFLSCLFALIKLKQLDEDDCIYITQRKRISLKQ